MAWHPPPPPSKLPSADVIHVSDNFFGSFLRRKKAFTMASSIHFISYKFHLQQCFSHHSAGLGQLLAILYSCTSSGGRKGCTTEAEGQREQAQHGSCPLEVKESGTVGVMFTVKNGPHCQP